MKKEAKHVAWITKRVGILQTKSSRAQRCQHELLRQARGTCEQRRQTNGRAAVKFETISRRAIFGKRKAKTKAKVSPLTGARWQDPESKGQTSLANARALATAAPAPRPCHVPLPDTFLVERHGLEGAPLGACREWVASIPGAKMWLDTFRPGRSFGLNISSQCDSHENEHAEIYDVNCAYNK